MDLHDYKDVAENYDRYLEVMFATNNVHEGFQELDQKLLDTLRDNLSLRAIENVSNILTVGTRGYDFKA